MRTVVPAILFLCLATMPVRAQVDPEVRVDPAVTYVSSGGQWIGEESKGHFRVIVRSVGWDHVVSNVTVQWVAEDVQTSSYAIVRSQLVFDPAVNGPWSFGQPALEAHGTYVLVTMEGTNSYTLERGQLVFQAGPVDSVIVVTDGSVGDWEPHVR